MQSLLASFLKPAFLKPKPLIDQNSADFIFETVAWVLHNFDSEEFFKRTRLVAPTNEFFPGRVNSVDEKAQNIFAHTVSYAGLDHWPFVLKSLREREASRECQLPPVPQDILALIQRNSFAKATAAKPELDKGTGEADKQLTDTCAVQVPVMNSAKPLFVFYNPQQTLKPEDLSASYAHVLAQHLIIQSAQQPPGGNQFFAEASEVLASMMGFGVLLANSAYTFRGGCGSCYNAMANRQPALTESDSVFVLALFCRLKGIGYKEGTAHLKKYLRGSYKRALKQIDERLDEVNRLKRIN
mgnify:CR=1 FL=1